TAIPRFSSSSAVRSMERTTPFTCGCQASVTMRTLRGRRMPLAGTAFAAKGKSGVAGNEKGPGFTPGPLNLICCSDLALGELEGTAGLGATVLLALDHAAVAGEEAALLQHGAKLGLVEG